MRGDQRRKRHEHAVAAAESAGDVTSETVQQVEVLRHLVTALEQLNDPYRSVIVQRFFDQLPPREIAKTHQVPVNTVRTWIRRGLEQMRQELHREQRLGPQWAMVLADWSHEKSAVVTAGLGTGMEAWIMTTSAKWWITAAAMIAVPTGFWISQESTSEHVAAELDRAWRNPAPVLAVDSGQTASGFSGEQAKQATSVVVVDRSLVSMEQWLIEGTLSNNGVGVKGEDVSVRVFGGTNPNSNPYSRGECGDR